MTPPASSVIDLRSDTVTLPTKGMREAMFSAPLGDDVFGEDPTVNALQAKAAAMFGQEAGLFCPSGTMTNQIAIKCHTRTGDEVICDVGAHIYQYEGGGIMANSGCSVHLLPGDRGRFTADEVRGAINDRHAAYKANTRLVNIENTSNRGGGSIWDLNEIKKIRKVCNENSLALHMDGARIFNALAITGTSPEEIGKQFDSISICLSKGLGTPVGSVLLGSSDFIGEALRVRKRLGGGMRQAGILAAAGIYALDHHVQRLSEDHRRAKALADVLQQAPFTEKVLEVITNIVVVELRKEVELNAVVNALEAKKVRVIAFGPNAFRLVTHLDMNDDALDKTIMAIKSIRI